MKKSLFTLLIVFVALVFTSCNSKNTLTLVLDYTPNTNHTGFYVAQAKGYYDELGIDIEIVQPPESGAPIVVASGKAEFGISFQDDLAAACGIDDPLNIITIGSIVSHNTSGFIYNTSSGINSPKDFEGKQVIVWDTPIITQIVRTIVEQDGGNPDNVELVYNNVSDTRQLLQGSNVVVWGYEGWDLVKIRQSGLDVGYMPLATINPTFDYYTPVIIANQTFTEENPEATQKFMEATAKGYNYAIENPTEAAAILLESVPELDENMVIESQNYLSTQYKSDSIYWGYIENDRWQAFYSWAFQSGLTPNDITQDTYTNEFLPED